jgi:radial spoke head protein 9
MVHTQSGIKKDYYIALGYIFNQKAEFPEKKFYFATNDYIFVELPEVEEQHIQYCQTYNSYFTGEPTSILVKVKQEASRPGSTPLKDFRELHRLAYVVRKIEEDTHVVPEGAFKLTPIRVVHKNNEFAGTLIIKGLILTMC